MIDFLFQFIWIQKLNSILLLAIGISFIWSVRATCAEYMMQTNNLKVVINSKAENVQFALAPLNPKISTTRFQYI